MENLQNETLDSGFIQNQTTRRRSLLPWWIKAFAWIFMAFGVFAPVGFIFGVLGFTFQLSLYGLSTNDPMSALGLTVTAIFFIKGVAAFALWTEKDWAINAGQIDAFIGICVCLVVMLFLPFISETNTGETKTFNIGFSFRIELLLLIPYLVKLGRIKSKWKELTENK
jgi:hypothetical protein